MGQQQLLLLILGVIIVGLAIAVGLSLFSAQSIQSNKDAIINDLNNLGAYCYQFKIRPLSMGGGSGSYANCTLPSKMSSNDNATYALSNKSANAITIKGTNANDIAAYVQGALDANGKFASGFTFGTTFN